jgi:hypothetical protein
MVKPERTMKGGIALCADRQAFAELPHER